jgi:hypothetical protein
MAKKRLFTSFDYDNDARLRDLFVGQSKHSDTPFEFVDFSVKAHMSGDWKEQVRRRMRGCDVVCVLCGENMRTATGVSVEVQIAQEEEIPYFLLAGYVEKNCTKPVAARVSDKMYRWTWENLKTLINGGR